MSTIQVKLSKRVVDQALAFKPDYDSNTAHLSRLLEMAIDNTLRLGSQAQPGDPLSFSNKDSSTTEKAVVSNARALPVDLIEEQINRNPDRPTKAKKDPFSSKRLSAELVPLELQQHADLIIDFWSVKKGTRSERAWNGLVNKLNAMTPEDQGKALTAAYEGGWASVFQPRPDAPQQGKWKQPEPEMKHPAYRDAREIIREQEERFRNIPSVTGGKGVLEHLGL